MKEKNAYNVAQNATCNIEFFEFANSDKPVKYYNLDVVLEIAHRVKSMRGLMLKTQLEEQLKNDGIIENNDKIIIYNDGIQKYPIHFDLVEETLWLSANQIADIFDTTKNNVIMHIQNIYEEGEIVNSGSKDSLPTEKEMYVLASDGKQYLTKLYNFDIVLAVGYRVKSSKAIFFRRWVSVVFKIHLKDKYDKKKLDCVYCRNDFLEFKNDYYQLKESIKHERSYKPGDALIGFVETKRFLESAKKEIIIVDNYIGHGFDDVLKNIKVSKTIITNPKNTKIETNDNYTVIKTNEFHDRYVLVDDICYIYGTSLEQIGEKRSSVGTVTDSLLINVIRNFKNNVVQKEVKKIPLNIKKD